MRDMFEGWAVVELLGHRRLVGRVSQVQLAGVEMLRVDIPTTAPTFLFVNPQSLYQLTPTIEAVVRAEVATEEENRTRAQRQLSAPQPIVEGDADLEDFDLDDQARSEAANGPMGEDIY